MKEMQAIENNQGTFFDEPFLNGVLVLHRLHEETMTTHENQQ